MAECESDVDRVPEPAGSVEKDEGEAQKVNLDDTLSRRNWYLGGDMSREAAVSILHASKSSNCFAVYKTPDDHFILSAKYLEPGEESPGGNHLVDHLAIKKDNSGHYQLPGQGNPHKDVVEAVEVFVATFDPPLLPALEGSSFETQISVADDPPEYAKANRVLKPDIAPLPDITSVKVDTINEAKAGRISPSSSGHFVPNRRAVTGQPTHGSPLPQWHRYETLHRYHPKNVCFGCCYRKRGWNGYRYAYTHNWYNCRGAGPLRVLALLLFWVFCGLFYGCFKGCSFLFTVCLYVCCGFYDSS